MASSDREVLAEAFNLLAAYVSDDGQDLLAAVRKASLAVARSHEIRVLERDILTMNARVFACNPDEAIDSDGYPLGDPKHPSHHSVHADLWDSREGK